VSAARALIALAALAVVAGCNKDKTVQPPAELVDLEPTLTVRESWSEGVGGGGEKLRLTLGLAGDGDTIYVAARDGEVRALDAANGRARWRADTELELTAGPGLGSGLVVVGTSEGDIVAMDAASGERKWKVRTHAEVLAPPLVTGDRVVVRSVDGRLRALDAAAGKELWVIEEQVPRLSLRGTAAPVAAGDTVICGFDTGKVMAVTLASGEILWQAQISTARGRTELERLADVDAAVRVAGTDVYAVGYHGRVAMLALDSGQVWWSRDVSSYRGIALDDDQVYVASSDGVVIALRRRDGSIVWQQEGLARRDLSTPAVDGDAVVVGDFEGYLHWLDRATGKFVARKHAGGERIAAAPLAMGGRIFTIDEGGHVTAYQSGGSAGN
jgi:outer membrane protein assembly factor BamB